jgi:hypothetical protein
MRIWDKTGRIPPLQRVIAVLWLSFLTAGIATGVFFSAIDPMELRYCVDFPEVSRTAAYSIGFFLFWLLAGGTGLLSVYFTYPSDLDEEEITDG